jgi:hypothetical protein
MASDPSYVRLARRLTRGIQADLQTGWSIAGLDVKEFPADDKAAAKYVRNALRNGRLEAASKAEFDVVQEEAAALSEAAPSYSREERGAVAVQEHVTREAAAKSAERVAAARDKVDPQEDPREADLKRREALLEEQERIQAERDKKANAGKRKAAAVEDDDDDEDEESEEESEEAYTESSLTKLTKAELVAIASDEFALDTADLDTKAKLVDAILAEQDADEGE